MPPGHAAVHQHQVGQALLGVARDRRLGRQRGQLLVAAAQHLAHGGVVVAAGDALDVEAAVLAVLHLVVLVDHAGGLGGLARGVADVEALHAEAVQVLHRQVQRIHHRPGALALRALFGQQARQRQLAALDRHLQPDAALLARLVHRIDLAARLLAQGLQQGLVDRVAQHQQAAARCAGSAGR
jgi:hypothetical protein